MFYEIRVVANKELVFRISLIVIIRLDEEFSRYEHI
jgi:hypothetical protein